MTTTQNLNLPQWEADDRIMRTDFNDAMASIDAGVKSVADGIPQIITGQYKGNAAYPRVIDLGFTPKAVLIINCYGRTENGMNTYGGLIVPGHVLGSPQYPVAEITASGFRLLRDYINVNDSLYTYIALC